MSNTATNDVLSTAESKPAATVGMTAVLIPVLLSTLLTLGTVGGSVYYLLRTGKLAGASAAPAAGPPPVIIVAPPASHVMALEPMIVNLSDPGGKSYLRASVSLRIKDESKSEGKTEEKKDPKAVDSVAVEVRDTTLAVLSRQTSDMLLTAGGRDDLKHELEREYKLRNAGIPVIEVFFTDFLVQRG